MAIPDDIRVKLTFFQHPKTLRLWRKHPQAPYCLLQLWAWAAIHAQDGHIQLDAWDISLVAGWTNGPCGGEGPSVGAEFARAPRPDHFVDWCLEVGYLEQNADDTYQLHDWHEHQPWVVGAPERAAAAKKAGAASARARRTSNGSSTGGSTGRCENVRTPSPSPSPSPKKNPSGSCGEQDSPPTIRCGKICLQIQKPDLNRWKKAFPGVDLEGCIRRAEVWLHDNPPRRPKSVRGLKGFLTRWFGRDHDRLLRTGANPAYKPEVTEDEIQAEIQRMNRERP